MRDGWEEVGSPREWVLVNWGGGALDRSGGGQLDPGEARQCRGPPEEGWEAGGAGIGRVALLVEAPAGKEEGELRLREFNVQGWGEKHRKGAARYLVQEEADWGVGTEHGQSEWKGKRFAGYATRASCCEKEGEAKRGVVHFYPVEWERQNKVK